MRAVLKRILDPIRPYTWVLRYLETRTRRQVIAGPFSGMSYVGASFGGAYHPKLLGTYEKELWDVLAVVRSVSPDVIVNVGAAEGYYAVGLALTIPEARVVGFEATQRGRQLMQELAGLNGVGERLTIRGFCDTEELAESLRTASRPFALIDIEGGEGALLDPSMVPELRFSRILVELHDLVVPGIESLVRARFNESHVMTLISSTSRTLADFPLSLPRASRWLLSRWLLRSMYEWRQGTMSWLYLEPLCAPERRPHSEWQT
jgi:hypothetical protein